MDAINVILTRRSIRKYKPDPIPQEAIKELLEAAMSAPSASNKQPWHFVVITDRQVLDTIPQFHNNGSMLKFAPAAIAVCADVAQDETCWIQDCSAATENILLAAHARGLGAVWLGIWPVDIRVTELRKLVGIPNKFTPLCLVALGYPVEPKPPANRFDAARVHYGKW